MGCWWPETGDDFRNSDEEDITREDEEDEGEHERRFGQDQNLNPLTTKHILFNPKTN